MAFVAWWPFGLLYALFTALGGLVLGAYTTNSGLAAGLVNLMASLAMGLLTVFSVCIGLYPDAGTFAFGTDTSSLVLNLRDHGAARAQFGFGVLFLMFVPGITGALLAKWLARKFGELQTEKLAG